MFTEGTEKAGMIFDEWGDLKGRTFEPVDKDVETLAPFVHLKTTMEQLGWIYEGSLRWSEGQRLLVISYSESESFMELWHANGETQLRKRTILDCTETGIDYALRELRILQP